MFTITHVGFNTIIRVQDITVIVARRPAKKGMFFYETLSDTIAIDELLKHVIELDQLDAIKRLFSGYCPKREAYSYAAKISVDPKALVDLLEALGVLKEKKPVKDSVHAEYRLRDGYAIRLEETSAGLVLAEYEHGNLVSTARVLSLREGQSRIKKTVANIEDLENVSFQIIKPA
jgi:hypothetical protein